ncbi:hypothetical protein BDFB_006792 [Asbolus verrucosus]|uniref:Uncharacterized protein n=1 Tax=Asbolus verrucosus TaxID=1661398 RepID=A0A482W7K6_ASBVE|nr:hypothetical protein BDFB_006792 [Asbolus verrucosus]
MFSSPKRSVAFLVSSCIRNIKIVIHTRPKKLQDLIRFYLIMFWIGFSWNNLRWFSFCNLNTWEALFKFQDALQELLQDLYWDCLL